ncbi:MAG: Wzz/FepE/Etk N-terminal domain-containing protein, partial [Croceibacterium sp.]
MDATTTYALRSQDEPRDGGSGLGPVLRYSLALIRRNLLLIAGIVALAIALAVVLTMLETPRYTATSSVEINQETQKVLGDKLDSADGASSSNWNFDMFLNTQGEILRSRA